MARTGNSPLSDEEIAETVLHFIAGSYSRVQRVEGVLKAERENLRNGIEFAHRVGNSWEEIAEALGLSRQRVRDIARGR